MGEKSKKTPYLHDIPLFEAKARFNQALKDHYLWGVLGEEVIPLDEHALGRVLSTSIWAKISSPNYHASAMDGFAVRSSETESALQTDPTVLVNGVQSIYVDTGDSIPAFADAVIPIENVEPIDALGVPAEDPRYPYAIRIRAAVTPWQHVRSMGEDIVASQLIFSAGHVLRAVDLGAIAASGHAQVRVSRRPRVAILPTGSELVPIGQPILDGQIIEYNSLILSAQVNAWGGISERFPITADNFESIRAVVENASQASDLVLLNAGSSAGSEDFSAEVVASLGELLIHGVAVRPGHPVILGIINHNDRWIPIIGVPGYPVSAALTGEIFIEPLLANWLGRAPNEPNSIRAKITRKITSPAGDDDYLRVAVGKVDNQILAAPLSRGAGVITSLVQADGLVILPRGIQGLQAGAEVDVHLYRKLSEIERTIFAVGSHDISLDLLVQHLARKDRRLTSSNVGSLAGLLAVKRGEAHFAGSHLLDPETGIYNLAYIRQYIPDRRVIVLGFVNRQQGLIVEKGNPKEVLKIEDIVNPSVIFVNRQHGAGTRVLLDHLLIASGIDSDSIQGYDREVYTHLAVAAAVKSGSADCGLGIAAAAEALDLDFIPVHVEEYDLVVPSEYYYSDLFTPIREILDDDRFHEEVEKLPGYNTSRMGKIIAESGGL
jgi:putative molybdopterin biosynthesis protein